MRGTARNLTAAERDTGTGGFVVWIVVYAVFMVGLIALNGGSRSLGFHGNTFAERIAR